MEIYQFDEKVKYKMEMEKTLFKVVPPDLLNLSTINGENCDRVNDILEVIESTCYKMDKFIAVSKNESGKPNWKCKEEVEKKISEFVSEINHGNLERYFYYT